MQKFIIHKHGRLQEWVAEEKGYFKAEGLDDYELASHGLLSASTGADTPKSAQVAENLDGAFQSYEKGREASVSCACHWTVNMAASADHGKLWGECYTITPCAIFVAPESKIKRPEDLANIEVHVGYQSGSHYTTIQALEPFLKKEEIKLKFSGSPALRVDQMLDRSAQAVTVFGGQYYILEQLGYRKILDCTFMIAAIIPKDVSIEDARKYFAALRRAQADIDVMHQSFAHYYANEIPQRHLELVDVRRFGPGERFVFEPYSQEMYEKTHQWVEERGIFASEKEGHGSYADSVIRLTEKV